MVFGVCSGYLCLWSDQSQFVAFFVAFNLRTGPAFIFESLSF
jgi:hypothetical protein